MTVSIPASTAYDDAQFNDNFPPGVEGHYWFQARNAILDRTLRAASRRAWIPDRAAILEIGCGTGIVVAGLAARGHDIAGVELGRPPRSMAPHRIRTGIRAQDLEPEVRSRMNVLMLCDVIEHVPDDVSLLVDTLAAFPSCRAVVITVPGRPELWSDHDRYYGHYRRYTRRSLASTLTAAGVEPVGVRYMFRSLYAAAGLIRLAGQQRNPVMKRPISDALHRAAALVLDAEDRGLSRLPLPGLSVLGIGLRRTA